MEFVYIGNDYEYEYDVTRKATATGNAEAAASLATVTAHFSATDGGSAISGTSITLAERSETPGRYYGILDVTPLDSALTAYANQVIYEVFIVSGAGKTSVPVVVKANRMPA